MIFEKEINQKKIDFYKSIDLEYYWIKPATIIGLCLLIGYDLPPITLLLAQRMRILKHERKMKEKYD